MCALLTDKWVVISNIIRIPDPFSERFTPYYSGLYLRFDRRDATNAIPAIAGHGVIGSDGSDGFDYHTLILRENPAIWVSTSPQCFSCRASRMALMMVGESIHRFGRVVTEVYDAGMVVCDPKHTFGSFAAVRSST